MPKVSATYAMANWEEDTLRDVPPPGKCTSVKAHGRITGALEGEGESFYIIAYLNDVGGSFSGYTSFTGTLDGKKGSFILRDEGMADERSARSTWIIVEGSGTGELKGIEGTGGFVAEQGLTFDFTLDYTL